MFWNPIIYIGMCIARFPLMTSYKIFGKHNVPQKGPFIVVVNHSSIMDTALTFFVAPWYRRIFFAAKTWENAFFVGWGMKKGGAIYINRGRFDRGAMQEALESIKGGSIFGMAPEGTRSQAGQMGRGRDGAAYLATKSGVPVIPVGITGAHKWRENWRSMRWTHLVHVDLPLFLVVLGGYYLLHVGHGNSLLTILGHKAEYFHPVEQGKYLLIIVVFGPALVLVIQCTYWLISLHFGAWALVTIYLQSCLLISFNIFRFTTAVVWFILPVTQLKLGTRIIILRER